MRSPTGSLTDWLDDLFRDRTIGFSHDCLAGWLVWRIIGGLIGFLIDLLTDCRPVRTGMCGKNGKIGKTERLQNGETVAAEIPKWQIRAGDACVRSYIPSLMDWAAGGAIDSFVASGRLFASQVGELINWRIESDAARRMSITLLTPRPSIRRFSY